MIDVQWQNEQGACIERYTGPPIGLRFCEFAPLNSVCLRFIAPYGDTTFNAAQDHVLAAELSELARTAKNANIANQANALLVFVGSVRDPLHMYLKFIGDYISRRPTAARRTRTSPFPSNMRLPG